MRTFATIADSGMFTRAGGRLHRTQSTVSPPVERPAEHVVVSLEVARAKPAREKCGTLKAGGCPAGPLG